MTWASLFSQFADLITKADDGRLPPVGMPDAIEADRPITLGAELPEVVEADSPAGVDLAIWPAANFHPAELTCRCCGRIKVNVDALLRLQALRENMGRALRVNSSYRCPVHNANVGGAPLSQHKQGKAFDISASGWTASERVELVAAAYHAGFTGFGGYNSFLHVDTGRRRQWGQTWAWPGKVEA